jgi:hypothetical protein
MPPRPQPEGQGRSAKVNKRLFLTPFIPSGIPPRGFADELAPQAEALAVQRDGKLVVAGFSQEGIQEPVAFALLLARYRTDGSLDPSFAGDGIVGKAPQAHGGTEYHDVAVTGKGTILVAGGRDEDGGASLPRRACSPPISA